MGFGASEGRNIYVCVCVCVHIFLKCAATRNLETNADKSKYNEERSLVDNYNTVIVVLIKSTRRERHIVADL